MDFPTIIAFSERWHWSPGMTRPRYPVLKAYHERRTSRSNDPAAQSMPQAGGIGSGCASQSSVCRTQSSRLSAVAGRIAGARVANDRCGSRGFFEVDGSGANQLHRSGTFPCALCHGHATTSGRSCPPSKSRKERWRPTSRRSADQSYPCSLTPTNALMSLRLMKH